MVVRISDKTLQTALNVGESLSTWRKLYGLKLNQVAQRAGVSENTLRKLEKGDPSVSFRTFLDVGRSLGLLGKIEESVDPMNSDIGRERSSERLPKRVR
jgi:transcriptional regulator with XRE-family HTH domain